MTTPLPDLETVELERRGRATWLVLNRPERLNAMDATLLAELEQALDVLAEDEGTRVIVIRGAGRAFSAGYDIRPDEGSMVAYDGERDITESQRHLAGNIARFMKVWDHPKPVIAAVHGYCLAGASQLCSLCDITVVAEEATIGLPSLPIGGGYITPLWTPLVGPKRAKQMSFVAGSKISGTTAAEWGWANYAVPEVELWDDVTALATEIAKVPAPVLRMKKLAINRVFQIQSGWPTTAFLGADMDALLHHNQEIQDYRRSIREEGLREAIRRFDEGG